MPEIFARIYKRHGHRCPMSTLGGRLGMAALAQLTQLTQGDGGMTAVFTARTCALDGILETTGCSEENGHLMVAADGRHALRLERNSESCEVELTARAMELAGSYRALCDRLERGWEALAPEEQTARKAAMESALDDLLPQLWCADDHDLVRVITE